MNDFHIILVPLDTTELGQRTLDVALHQSASFGASLVLLRILDKPAALEIGDTDRDLDAIEAESNALIQQATERAATLGLTIGAVRVEVRAGGVVDAIITAADDVRADLIVMGTHGRAGLGDAISGSTTERVVNRATASVIAVKPVGFPYLRDEGPAVR